MVADQLPDHYAVLGVPPTADHSTIQKAYRKQAMLRHPDRGGSHAQMVELIAAWEILSDPERRAHYNAARRQPQDSRSVVVARYESQAATTRAASYPSSWSEFSAWQEKVFIELSQAKNVTPKYLFQFGGFMVVAFLIYGPVSGYTKANFPDSLGAMMLNALAILVSVLVGVLSGTMVFNLTARLFPGLTRYHAGRDPDSDKPVTQRRGLSIGLGAAAVGFAGMALSGIMPLSQDGRAIILGIGFVLLLGGLIVYLIEKSIALAKREKSLNHSTEFRSHRSKWTLIWATVTLSVLALLVWTIANL